MDIFDKRDDHGDGDRDALSAEKTTATEIYATEKSAPETEAALTDAEPVSSTAGQAETALGNETPLHENEKYLQDVTSHVVPGGVPASALQSPVSYNMGISTVDEIIQPSQPVVEEAILEKKVEPGTVLNEEPTEPVLEQQSGQQQEQPGDGSGEAQHDEPPVPVIMEDTPHDETAHQLEHEGSQEPHDSITEEEILTKESLEGQNAPVEDQHPQEADNCGHESTIDESTPTVETHDDSQYEEHDRHEAGDKAIEEPATPIIDANIPSIAIHTTDMTEELLREASVETEAAHEDPIREAPVEEVPTEQAIHETPAYEPQADFAQDHIEHDTPDVDVQTTINPTPSKVHTPEDGPVHQDSTEASVPSAAEETVPNIPHVVEEVSPNDTNTTHLAEHIPEEAMHEEIISETLHEEAHEFDHDDSFQEPTMKDMGTVPEPARTITEEPVDDQETAEADSSATLSEVPEAVSCSDVVDVDVHEAARPESPAPTALSAAEELHVNTLSEEHQNNEITEHEVVSLDSATHEDTEHDVITHEAADPGTDHHDELSHEVAAHDDTNHDPAGHDLAEHESAHDYVVEHDAIYHDAIAHEAADLEVASHEGLGRESVDHEAVLHEVEPVSEPLQHEEGNEHMHEHAEESITAPHEAPREDNLAHDATVTESSDAPVWHYQEPYVSQDVYTYPYAATQEYVDYGSSYYASAQQTLDPSPVFHDVNETHDTPDAIQEPVLDENMIFGEPEEMEATHNTLSLDKELEDVDEEEDEAEEVGDDIHTEPPADTLHEAHQGSVPEVEHAATMHGQDDLFEDDSEESAGSVDSSDLAHQEVPISNDHDHEEEHGHELESAPVPVQHNEHEDTIVEHPIEASHEISHNTDVPPTPTTVIGDSHYIEEHDNQEVQTQFAQAPQEDERPVTPDASTPLASQFQGLANSRHAPQQQQQQVPVTPPRQIHDDEGLDDVDFMPRDVTHVPWQERHGSIDATPGSVRSQATLSTSASSSFGSPSPWSTAVANAMTPQTGSIISGSTVPQDDPFIRTSWSGTPDGGDDGLIFGRGKPIGQLSYDYHHSHLVNDNDKRRSLPLDTVQTPPSNNSRPSSVVATSSPSSLFQRMRSIFEPPNGAPGVGVPEIPAKPMISAATSTIHDDEDEDDQINEKSSLLQASAIDMPLH